MPSDRILTKTGQVIDKLGGNKALGLALGVARNNPSNWRAAGRFPGWTLPEISALLVPLGYFAAGELFAGKPKPHKPHKRKKRKRIVRRAGTTTRRQISKNGGGHGKRKRTRQTRMVRRPDRAPQDAMERGQVGLGDR
jgi:hypothetical protein